MILVLVFIALAAGTSIVAAPLDDPETAKARADCLRAMAELEPDDACTTIEFADSGCVYTIDADCFIEQAKRKAGQKVCDMRWRPEAHAACTYTVYDLEQNACLVAEDAACVAERDAPAYVSLWHLISSRAQEAWHKLVE